MSLGLARISLASRRLRSISGMLAQIVAVKFDQVEGNKYTSPPRLCCAAH